MSSTIATQENKVFIEAVGLLATGIPSWQAFLNNDLQPLGDEFPKLTAERLPRAERRRATKITRLAFMTSEQSAAASSMPAGQLANVFVSSCSSTDIVDSVCLQLCDDPMLVSPTQFHNSVHNAPVGYWSIASESKMPSSSICGHDHSFAAGLLDTYSQVLIEKIPAMLTAADNVVAGRLQPFRDIAYPFATSFVLTPNQTKKSLASLTLSTQTGQQETRLTGELEAMRAGNPAARSLPFLLQLAAGNGGECTFVLNGCQLVASLTPVSAS